MKRRIRLMVAALFLSLGLGTVLAIHETKPANAAQYCSPFFDYNCYMRWTICGPFKSLWLGGEWVIADRCGVYA